MEEQQEKTQGKKQDNLLLKRVHIWWRLCDRQPDEEKVRR